MKKLTLLLSLLIVSILGYSQNTFPLSGKVGVGTNSPLSDLHVNGIIRWGGYNTNYFFSGQDITGGYIEQIGSNSSTSKIRLQSSKLGDMSNYSQFIIDPEQGFSFKSIGGGSCNVGIGTSDTKGYRLAVAGNMVAESVAVKLQGTWPDYVFAKDYQLPSLSETEKHINEKGHLPGIPTAQEVKANGINVGEMNAKLLKKIEELTLYLIGLDKKVNTLSGENKELKDLLLKSNTRIKKIK